MSAETQNPPGTQVLETPPGPNGATARDHLVEDHLPLVHRLCGRFRHSGEPFEDLVQVGIIGLVRASKKYDPSRGVKFMAFAIPFIVGEVKNYFRDHGWAVKLPRKLQTQKREVQRNVEVLRQQLGRSPTIGEIVEATGFSQEEVFDTFEVANLGRPLSLEAEYDKDGNTEPSALLNHLGREAPELIGLVDKLDLAHCISCLSQREKAIISLKFYAGLSQSTIAQRLGVSQMHVSRLQRNALTKLKGTLQGDSTAQAGAARRRSR